MTAALHAILTLTFTPGLGPRKIKALVGHFGSDTLADLAADDFRQVEGIGPKLAQSIVGSRPLAQTKADGEVARAQRL